MPNSKQHLLARTHKIALKPSPAQRHRLAQHADYARDAYNWTLAHFKESQKAGKPCPVSMLFPMWEHHRAPAYPRSTTLCQSAAQHAVYALGDAIERWQDNAQDNEFPRFHRQDHKPSFRADQGARTVRCEGKRIVLPGIGRVRMFEPLRYEGDILTVTVTHEALRWLACVTVRIKPSPAGPGDEIIGVDVGLDPIAACSDGTRYEIPEALRAVRRQIGRYRRQLARQVQGSARHERVWRQLQDARCRARRLRDAVQHRAAKAIVAKARLVVMESLDVCGMMRQGGRYLAGGIARAAMSALQQKVAYRCAAAKVTLLKTPADFPSTRRCSRCGALREMPLKQRVYECGRCSLVIDRDDNAALNLKHYGERSGL